MKKIYLFLSLALLCLSLNAQDSLRVRDVFDFEVGDKFHYRTSLDPQAGLIINQEILGKWSSPGGDTIFYERLALAKEVSLPGTPINGGEDLIFYTHLDDFIVHTIFGPEPCLDYDSSECRYEVEVADFCGHTSNLIRRVTNVDGVGENSYTYAYARGLGDIEYRWFSDNAPGAPSELWMIYFKKGTEECGTPDDILLDTKEVYRSQESVFTVAPNPVVGELWIQTKSSGTGFANLRLYQIDGSMLNQWPRHNLSESINLTDLPKGLYLLQIESDQGWTTQKLIKK